MQFIFQKRILIFSIIFFLASMFLFGFLFVTINKNKEISELARQKKQEETTHMENIKSNTDLVEAIEPERILLESHFVQSSNVVPFLDTIERLAKEVETEAKVDSVNVEKDTSSLVVDLKVLGSFENIYKLILLLENSQYNLEFFLADIQNIDGENITTNETAKWTANFKIRLKSFINQ